MRKIRCMRTSAKIRFIVTARSPEACPSGYSYLEHDPYSPYMRMRLGVGVNATREQIRSHYRQLCRLYHPDRQGQGPEDCFILITEAVTRLEEQIVVGETLRSALNTHAQLDAGLEQFLDECWGSLGSTIRSACKAG